MWFFVIKHTGIPKLTKKNVNQLQIVIGSGLDHHAT